MTRSKDAQPNYQMPQGAISVELNMPPVRITKAQALAMPGDSFWFRDGGGNYLTFVGVLAALEPLQSRPKLIKRDARGKSGKRRVMDAPANPPLPDTTRNIEEVRNELQNLKPKS